MKTFVLIFCAFLLLGFYGHAQNTDSLSVFPNPFADSTKITLHNLENDTTTLTIFSIDGNLIAQPIHKQILSGTIVEVFRADTLEDGLYMVHLETNFGTQSVVKVLKSNVVSIGEWETSNDILVYPNPASSEVYLGTDLEVISVQLFDETAHLIKVWDTKPIQLLDVHDLKSGLYFLHIQTATGEYIRKIEIKD